MGKIQLTNKEKAAYICMGLGGTFLLSGYSFIRSSTPSLFVTTFGKENLPLAMGIMTVCVLAAVKLYTHLLTLFGARKTFRVTTLFSAVIILGSYLGIKLGFDWLSGVVHIYKDIYIVLLIEQMWSFLNSTVSLSAAKKFNGPLMGLMSLGPILAGQFVGNLVGHIGTLQFLPLATVLLLPVLFMMEWGFSRCGTPAPKQKKQGGHSGLGLDLFRQYPRLFFLLLAVLCSQMVAATTTLRLQTLVVDVLPSADAQTAYLGAYYSYVNMASAIMQFIVTPFLLTALPATLLHMGIPMLHLGAAVMAILYPSLETVAAAALIFKSVDYSLFRGAKELLYMPHEFDVQYRAKEVIDVLGYRVGKGSIAGVIAVSRKFGIIAESGYSTLALASAGLWLCFAYPLGYRKKKRSLDASQLEIVHNTH